MPAEWGRPADLVEPPTRWRAANTVFRLDGLDAATQAGVLTQWAFAEHIRVLLTFGRIRSARAFALEYGLSEDRLHNFLNGNRIARFEDWAAVLEIFGPASWPEPDRTSKLIAAARARAEKYAAASTKASAGASSGFSGSKRWNLGNEEELGGRGPGGTGSSARGRLKDMEPHPEADTIEAAFSAWLFAQPEVVAHLGSDDVEVDLRAGLCGPGQAGIEVFVGEATVAGRIWAPKGWSQRVGSIGMDGEFVLDQRGAELTVARVVVSGDDPALDDVNIEAATVRDKRLDWK